MRRDYSGSNNPNYKHGFATTNMGAKKLHIFRHPEKHRARNIVYQALKYGSMVRQPCEVCGEAKVEAHHEDYSKPRDVKWLCRKHHMERHKEMLVSQQLLEAT